MADQAPKNAYFLDDTGQVAPVPLDKVNDAYSRQWTPATPKQVADWKTEQAYKAKYGSVGQQIKTGLEGAAEGATFGASTLAETKLLGVNPEDIKGRAAVNPGIHLGSELGGGLGLALLTGGASAEAEGAAAAGEGASALSRIAATGAKEAVTGAKWGAAQGVGNLIHESALGDPNLSVQHIVEQVGLSTLLGGTLGGALGLGGQGLAELIGKSRDAIGSAFTKGKSALGQLYSNAENVTGTAGNVANLMLEHNIQIEAIEQKLPGFAENVSTATPDMAKWMIQNGDRLGELEQAFPGTTKAMSRVDPATADELLNNWRQMVTDPNARKAMTTNLKEGMGNVIATTNNLLKRINTELGPQEEEELLNSVRYVKEPKVKAAYEDLTLKVGEAAQQMRAKAEQFPQAYAAKLEDIQSGLVRDLADVTQTEAKAGKVMPDDMVEAFRRLKTLRQQLDEQINWQADVGNLGLSERNAQKVLKELRADVSATLKNPDVWGEAGARKAALDEAQSQWLRATGKGSTFRKRFLENRIMLGSSSNKYDVAASKVNTWLNGMMTGKGEESAQAWGQVMDSARKVLAEADASAKNIPESTFDKSAAEQLINSTGDQIEQAKRAANVTAMHKQLMSGGLGIPNSGPVSPMLGGGLAGKAAFMVAPRITAAAKAVVSVPRTVTALAAIERMGAKSSKLIDAATKAIANGTKAAVPYAEAAAGALDHEKISELAANPLQLQAHLQKMTDDTHDHAPDTSQAMQTHVARTVAFLASKAPKAVQNGPLAPKLEPTRDQLAAYERCAEVAEQPSRILAHISAGTMTPDMLQTLNVCAPQMLAQMRMSMMTALGNAKTKPNYKQRLMLGAFMGQSLDGTATPQAIMANQMPYRLPSAKGAENQTGPGALRPSQTGMGKLKLGEAWATSGQARDRRISRGE